MAACGLSACGASHVVWKDPDNAPAIEREVVSFYEGWERRLGEGDRAGWAAAFAPAGLLVATDAAEVLVGDDEIRGSRVRLGTPGTALEIGLGTDGRSAWLADADPGERTRATVLVERNGARWQVLMTHSSRAVPEETARALEEQGGFPEPRDLKDAVPEEARQLAEIFSASTAGVDAFTGAVSKRPGVMAIGPGPDDRYHGTHEVTEWIRGLYARPEAQLVRDGGLRAAIATGGELGYVVTNLDIITHRGGHALTRPCRLTVVFAREGDSWAIVHIHLSHGAAAAVAAR